MQKNLINFFFHPHRTYEQKKNSLAELNVVAKKIEMNKSLTVIPSITLHWHVVLSMRSLVWIACQKEMQDGVDEMREGKADGFSP